MFIVIFLIALVGFLLSLYSYKVEQKMKKDMQFKPVCDISDRISCSKAFTSKYSKLFGISNSIIGMVFYAIIMVFALFGSSDLILLASVASAIMSVVFAYLLYFKVKSICVVCSLVYVINFLLLVVSCYMFC